VALATLGSTFSAAGPVDGAVDRGLAFLARSWQGDAYDDEYLRFVYPDEKLDCPLPDCRLTYRLLDAYINLAFLDRAAVPHGPAQAQFSRGREVLEAIVPEWRERGLYNVKRDPVAGGVALDTYCIVGLLSEDRAMAGVAAAHLDGDDWLPDNHYDDLQSFRKLADETWCVRLLQFASRPGRRQVPRLARAALDRGRELLAQDRPLEFRVNVALHLLYLLNDLDDRSLRGDRDPLEKLLLAAAEDPGIQNDLLSQANILEALASGKDVPEPALRPLAERLLSHQEDDGGWHSMVGETGTGLRVFTTMRALLALTGYERRNDSAVASH
jgi:hypothetical protein